MENIFIQTLAQFESHPDEAMSTKFWVEMGFNLSAVITHNKATQEDYTVLEFISDERWLVAIKYDEFVGLLKKNYSVIPWIDCKAAYEFKEQKKEIKTPAK